VARVAEDVRRARGEAGSTLVELLVAIAIMGVAVVTVVMAMSATFTTSAVNRQATNAAIVARDYAEAVELAAAGTNAWCSSSYTTSYTPPSGYTVTPAFGACPANTSTTPQFQTVTITVTSPSGATETLRTVVRKP
jgi:type II secretory pathway pseudopilin PulG